VLVDEKVSLFTTTCLFCFSNSVQFSSIHTFMC
jgi:hypothetical protein